MTRAPRFWTLDDPLMSVEEASARRVGTTLKDKWVLEQLIGIGGMIVGALGIVYLLIVPPREEAGESRAARRRAQREDTQSVGEEPAT